MSTEAPPKNKSRKPKFTRLRRRRAVRRLTLYAFLSIVILGFAGSVYEIESDHFKSIAGEFLESMYDRRIEVGKASFNFLGRVTLHDVKVHNPPGYSAPLLLSAPRIHFTLGLTGGETSAFRPKRIEVVDPEFWLERPKGGRWNTESLWIEKEAAAALPTFLLPIEIDNATVHLFDQTTGFTGAKFDFEKADINYTVMSDGSKIRTRLTAEKINLPGGGFLDLSLEVEPARRHAIADIRMTGADVRTLAPYYDFLRLFKIESGRTDVAQKMEFSGGEITMHGNVKINNARIIHPHSNSVFEDVSPEIVYHTVYNDTKIRLKDVAVLWKNSRIEIDGELGRKHLDTSATALRFRTEKANGEEISFLLSDPKFRAVGPVTGECLIESTTDEKGRIAGEYNATMTLDDATVSYGEVIEKPRGVVSHLSLRGPVGLESAKPDEIKIHVGSSEVELQPRETGWKLSSRRLAGADMARFIVPLAKYESLKVDGFVNLDMEVGRNGSVSGLIDFNNAGLTLNPVLSKPAGTPATLKIDATISGDRIQLSRSHIRLGQSSISVSGSWTKMGADLDLKMHNIRWSDISHFSPYWVDDVEKKAHFSGTASGHAAIKTLPESDQGIGIVSDLDLLNSTVRLADLGQKDAGIPASVAIDGNMKEGVLIVEKGELRYLDSELNFSGDIGSEYYNVTARGRRTGLDGLRVFLASELWKELERLEIDGPGGIEIQATARGDEMKLIAQVEADDAILTVPGIWKKSLGERLSIRTQIVKGPEGTEIEKFEVSQGTSNLTYSGKISTLGRLSGDLRANLDVPSFTTATPGLRNIDAQGRRGDEALDLISDPNNRAAISWKITGTLENPELVLNEEELRSRVMPNLISRQIKGIAGLLFFPVKFSTTVVENVFN